MVCSAMMLMSLGEAGTCVSAVSDELGHIWRSDTEMSSQGAEQRSLLPGQRLNCEHIGDVAGSNTTVNSSGLLSVSRIRNGWSMRRGSRYWVSTRPWSLWVPVTFLQLSSSLLLLIFVRWFIINPQYYQHIYDSKIFKLYHNNAHSVNFTIHDLERLQNPCIIPAY